MLTLVTRIILISVVCLSQTLWASRLPTLKGLEGDIEFWKQIFSTYAPNQCVYHDRSELSHILAVLNVPTESRKRKSIVKKHKALIRSALYKFSKAQAPRSKLERQIHSKLRDLRLSRKQSRLVAQRIRCQRGVDFSKSLNRSKKYIDRIKKIFHEHGVPEDLAYLPHLESGFNPRARSHAGARGLWQFMKPVGRNYGLKINRFRDERIYPIKSTIAAARLLNTLKKNHRTWPLAITAYNYGTNGMRRAINKFGYDYMLIRNNHKTGIFGFAVKNYYPSLLAVRDLMEGQKTSDLVYYRVKKGDSLFKIARKFDVSIRDIKKANSLRTSHIQIGQRIRIAEL